MVLIMEVQQEKEMQCGDGQAATRHAQPLITVAICTRNRVALLRAAMVSVMGQLRSDTEMLLVDNASTDETPAVAAAFAHAHSAVTVVREAELGLSVARNTALRVARGEYVIFLDDDAIAEAGWLDAYADLFHHPPTIDVIGAGGAVFPRYEVTPPAWLDPMANTMDWSRETCVFKKRGGPWGCNFALHRARTLALGGFNPALGRKGKGMGAHEESDLFEKLQRGGGVFWWVPQARIRHHVATERLTFWFHSRSEFSGGRTAAYYKLGQQPKGLVRFGWRIVRFGVAPLQIIAYTLLAAVAVLFRPLHVAAGTWFRACRNAGFMLGLVENGGAGR